LPNKKVRWVMENFIITIGRQYGSGGKEIGLAIADRLGIKCYDRTLIELAASKAGVSEESVKSLDEMGKGSLFVPLANAYYGNVLTGNFEFTLSDKLYVVQSEIIKNIAINESAVIVGRCANVILESFKNVLRLFIHAPIEERIKKVMARESVDAKKAEQMINKIDRKRKSYYSYYTDREWADMNDYDLIVSATLGVEAIVELVCSVLRAKKLIR